MKQRTIQIDNQTMERLRVIDATLTFKLDLILSGISRLYFTQAVLADLECLWGQQAETEAQELPAPGGERRFRMPAIGPTG